MPTNMIIWPYTLAVRYIDNEREIVERQIVAYATQLAARTLDDHGDAAFVLWDSALRERMRDMTTYLMEQKIIVAMVSPLETLLDDHLGAHPMSQRTYGKAFSRVSSRSCPSSSDDGAIASSSIRVSYRSRWPKPSNICEATSQATPANTSGSTGR